ncbi:acyl-CoA synthetase [Novosphingobium sediminicola]|uniref:Long-chain acyl-CoA synthetase n=1 Tax=Novosphingobium sediminicola TaxID=563162 RepID=A0A7W6G896_9SPHN|nr:acyl-CoA synthetase [Novosphingobium sediminicola]MBB3957208.1 long-chain acyl-CoA synthetase [Novosphingobium sediminicola]
MFDPPFPSDRQLSHPRHFARICPEKPACIFADTDDALSYGAMEAAANQGAHFLRSMGLRRGDALAVMLDNEAATFTIAWAAQRCGLYLTSISTRLSPQDAAYILHDCGARLLVLSDRLAELSRQIAALAPDVPVRTIGGPQGWQEAIVAMPITPIGDESPGADMLYSSGTTGRPKGVKPPLPEGSLGQITPLMAMGKGLYGMDHDMVYLSTSPLYHAAPLRWALTAHRFGASVVVMNKFDAEAALGLVQKHRVTHGTWVPTHFVRLLKLDESLRKRYDLSSMRAAIHAGAPCAVAVKQAMIDWWGPIIEEYYSGTEMCGITALCSQEWLERPGSVGKAVLGELHILDDEGQELPIGHTGNVYFAHGPAFEYHQDPDKTRQAHNDRGWATMGDIGHLDADDYLFLTDRKNFMIISGGVNIYPQEIENYLISHPAIADIAVVGAPDAEMGEIAVAVVQPVEGVVGDEALACDLQAYARQGLGGIKAPKRFEFRRDLPREPTGKLLKSKLVEEFRAGAGG